MGDIEELKNNSETLDFHRQASGSDCDFCNQNEKWSTNESLLEKMKISEVCFATFCFGGVFLGWVDGRWREVHYLTVIPFMVIHVQQLAQGVGETLPTAAAIRVTARKNLEQ